MKWSDVFKKQYMSAKDIPDTGINGVISRIEIEDVVGEEKAKDTKPVLYLEGIDKGITVNHTRREVLESAWGEESDDAIGKEIKVAKGRTLHMGKPVDCIVFFAVSPPSQRADTNATFIN